MMDARRAPAQVPAPVCTYTPTQPTMQQRIIIEAKPHREGEMQVRMDVIAAGAVVGTHEMSPDSALELASALRHAALCAKQDRARAAGVRLSTRQPGDWRNERGD